MLTVEETIAKEPLIKQTGLNGGGYYVEYRTDDARLTIEVAKKAAEMGANLLNYCKVIDFIYENGKVTGALVEDRLLSRTYQVKAKKIINAAGPWVDTLREKDGSKQGKTLHLTKGSHIVIDQSRFPLKQAVYFDTPDGRMVFAIPRDNKAYVGTTDTFYDQDPVAPRVTKEDRTYLLQAITYMFPDVDVTDHDIESSWAGVRPLIHEDGKAPSEISRKDEIWISDSGLITIAGGKLTGYRKMAQQVVDVVAKQFETDFYIKFDTCQTKRLPISGGDVGGSQGFAAFVEQQTKIGMQAGLHENASRKIAALYGANAEKVYEQIHDHEYEAEIYQLPLDVYAMLLYAIKQENVATPVDFLARRTGLILFNMEAAKQWAEGIISCMNEIFVWDDLQKARYTKELYVEIEAAENPL
jgi:glycerol-3-phosphate dehydrogenase